MQVMERVESLPKALQNSAIGEPIEIRVPASIANLGPGFETLALAVQLYVNLKVRRLPGKGELHIAAGHLQRAEASRIEEAYLYLAGDDSARVPSLSVELNSEIPAHAGLGSGAAATVAGLRLYESVGGSVSVQRMLQAARVLGCHPERAAASLLGGLTLSCVLPDGLVHATKFPWPDALGLVVLTPLLSKDSDEAGTELPNSVSRSDLVFNLQRVALLLQSLGSGDFSLLKHALDDRVNQPFVRNFLPGSSEALRLDHPDFLGICLSGSGPSVVAMAERNLWEVGEVLSQAYVRAGIQCQMRVLDVHHEPSGQPKIFRSGLLCCS